MKASELRICNLVMDENYNLVTITHEDFMGVNDDGGFPLRPIPLTEEWLVKFGFKKALDNSTDYKLDFRVWELRTFMIENKLSVNITFNGSIVIATDCKHVHTIQNLYFALTGEELTLQK